MVSKAVRVVTGTNDAPLTGARQLSATMNGNNAAFCAVTDAGAIMCWGFDVSGFLGRGDLFATTFALPVLTSPGGTPFEGAVEVRLGFDSACARKADGEVWCWGGDTLQQTGVDTLLPATVTPFPTGPLQFGAAVRLAANPGNTHCAVRDDGEVFCWGWNAYQQAGGGAGAESVLPTPVVTSDARLPLTGIVDLAPDRGMQAMCATTTAGALVCWGHPFPPAGAPDATSPYPIAIPLAGAGGAPLRLPLSSYGGRDGSLVYIDPNGKLTLGAGALPFAAQPSCDDVGPPPP
jgi:hypothetical protein